MHRLRLLIAAAATVSAFAIPAGTAQASHHCVKYFEGQPCLDDSTCEISDALAERSAIWAKYLRFYCLYEQ